MVIAVIKLRRAFVVVPIIGFFLLYLNLLGPMMFLTRFSKQKDLMLIQWFESESWPKKVNQRLRFDENIDKQTVTNGKQIKFGIGGDRDKRRGKTSGNLTRECRIQRKAGSDVQMLNLYSQLSFDNLNGGVWTQGFNITYDAEQVQNEKRLEVIVVPHSHCDPGWGWTFEEYYEMRTQHILNGMLKHLPQKPEMRFTYAEMSFFELWWSKLSEEDREKTKDFLRSGQLEILTGGWVMTDEANSRSFSIVMELFEGHEFLLKQLNYKPHSHWSIDPFGLSPTLAQFVKFANLTQMTIQRVHYSVKKYLAKKKLLEFRWRQMYARATETDIRAHMMPFLGYTSALTCGPDPKICCQFDFHLERYCNQGFPAPEINSNNVAERAKTLADQYRKKAQLYRLNTILVPLGDDFRYITDLEWEEQYTNYQQLFAYMNANSKLNIYARFGTLQDYFDLLSKRLDEEADPAHKDLPVLSGDFFTYADRDDHYWSGYYTSRPFFKHMDRTVQHYVRFADLLYSLYLWKTTAEGETLKLSKKLYNLLVESRRSLSLFQHHDGITGTSRDYVMLDYGHKMLTAIQNCITIIAHVTGYFLDIEEQSLWPTKEYYLDKLPEPLRIPMRRNVTKFYKTLPSATLILQNSLAVERNEVVCVIVGSSRCKVQRKGQDVLQQIQPRIDLQNDLFVASSTEFELCFEAHVPALGFEKFEVIEGSDETYKSTIELGATSNKLSIPKAVRLSLTDSIMLSNPLVTAKFNATSGYLRSIRYADQKEVDMRMEFLHYGARQSSSASYMTDVDSMSGPYLFLPDGPASPLSTDKNSFILLKGAVRQSLLLKGPNEAKVLQHIHLNFNSPYLDIINRVDVRRTYNFELVMRIQSTHFNASNEQFYTDLNGFQMIRRKRFEKLPIQAHFYPMTTAAYIDANNRRLTLLSRQSLGTASLFPGAIETILDRRLMQDDNRGIGQGVSDNKQTESHFRLRIESVASQMNSEENRAGYLSADSIRSAHTLNYPLHVFYALLNASSTQKLPDSWSPLKQAFPCDVHLFALRTQSQPTLYSKQGNRNTSPATAASLILERQGEECLATTEITGCKQSDGWFNFQDHFQFTAKSIKLATLTGLYEQNESLTSPLQLQQMDLKTIKIEF